MTAILKMPDVINRTGISRAVIYARVGDGSFPKPIKLGPRAIGWVEAEIEEWLQARVQQRDATVRLGQCSRSSVSGIDDE